MDGDAFAVFFFSDFQRISLYLRVPFQIQPRRGSRAQWWRKEIGWFSYKNALQASSFLIFTANLRTGSSDGQCTNWEEANRGCSTVGEGDLVRHFKGEFFLGSSPLFPLSLSLCVLAKRFTFPALQWFEEDLSDATFVWHGGDFISCFGFRILPIASDLWSLVFKFFAFWSKSQDLSISRSLRFNLSFL